MQQHKGKLVLVTGSTKGIGLAINKIFYHAGAKIVITSRSQLNIDKAISDFEEIGYEKDRVFVHKADLSLPEDVSLLTTEVQHYFSQCVDVLVNNTGGPKPSPVMELNETDWSKALNAVLLSVIRATSLVIPGMIEQKWGRIINIASSTAKEPAANMALSNVTRAGILSYTKTLSKEIGHYNITCNSILTSGVMTDRFYDLLGMPKGSEEAIKRIEELSADVPMKRFITPEEFAKYISFLASDDASYITGSAIPIDGGTLKGLY